MKAPPYPFIHWSRLPDDPDNSLQPLFVLWFRLFHLEQSSGNSTDDLFPDHHHGL